MKRECEVSHSPREASRLKIRLELNYSSSRNFIEYARALAAIHHEVQEVFTSLSVEDRGKWGEVVFAVDRNPADAP